MPHRYFHLCLCWPTSDSVSSLPLCNKPRWEAVCGCRELCPRALAEGGACGVPAPPIQLHPFWGWCACLRGQESGRAGDVLCPVQGECERSLMMNVPKALKHLELVSPDMYPLLWCVDPVYLLQLLQHYEILPEKGAQPVEPKTRTLMIPSKPINLCFLPRAWRKCQRLKKWFV